MLLSKHCCDPENTQRCNVSLETTKLDLSIFLFIKNHSGLTIFGENFPNNKGQAKSILEGGKELMVG